jgi:hypothetical protein
MLVSVSIIPCALARGVCVRTKCGHMAWPVAFCDDRHRRASAHKHSIPGNWAFTVLRKGESLPSTAQHNTAHAAGDITQTIDAMLLSELYHPPPPSSHPNTDWPAHPHSTHAYSFRCAPSVLLPNTIMPSTMRGNDANE